MNIAKRILSLLLCAALTASVTACKSTAPSGNPGGQGAGTAAGAWVEEEISISSDIGAFNKIVQTDDGKLITYGLTKPDDLQQTKVYKCVTADYGKTWEQAEVKWDNAENGLLISVSSSENGTLIYQSIVQGETRDENTFRVFLQRPGEEIAEYFFEGMDFKSDSNIIFTFINNSTVYAVLPTAKNEQMHAFYDISENKLLGYLKPDPRIFTTPVYLGIAPVYGENKIYFTNYNQSNSSFELLIGGPGTDIEVAFPKIPTNESVYCTTSDKSGAFYFANKEGIFSIAKGGSICEKIVNSNGMQLNILGSQKLFLASDGSFISIALANESTESNYPVYKIFRYYFDESVTAPSQGSTLQIWSLQDNATIRNAVVTALAQEGIHAEYTVGLPAGDALLGPNEVAREDVLRAFNSEMLAGGGPDIIVLDGLDYETFAQKGMLADLSGIIEAGTLTPFIADAFYKAGETFALPVSFSVPLLFADEGELKGINSLADLQSEILSCPPRADTNGYEDEYYAPMDTESRFGISFLSVKQLCDFTLQTSANALIKNGQTNADACKEAYKFINGVAKHYNMKNYRPDSKQPRNGIIMDSNIILMDGGYEYNITSRAKYGWELMLNPSIANITRFNNTTQKKYKVEFIAQPGLCEGVYIPGSMLSINSQTPLKEQAEKFIKVVFKEGQAQAEGGGLSAINNDFNALLSGANEQAVKILSSLKTPVMPNPVLSQKFYENAQKMIDNGLSAEDAAAGFEKDMALYLAERQ